MAMQFSKEDQEKLKKDHSEIYRKRTDETNREDIKKLSREGKWQHFVDYYLKGVIVAILIVAILAGGIIQAATKKASSALYIAIQKDAFDENKIAAFEETVEEYLKLNTDDEIVTVDISCSDQQLQTYFYAGTADILITSEEAFKAWGEAQYFYDLENNKEVSFYQEYDEKYLYKTQYITSEDILNNTKTNKQETKPSDEKEYHCGLYLTDSEKYRQIGGGIEKPVLGIANTTKRLTEAKKFAEFMMDNSQKMNLKGTGIEEKN